MSLNSSAGSDARNALAGKDGALYRSEGGLLATVETFSAKANITTQPYRPLGTFMDQNVPISLGVTLTFSQFVIEDDQLMKDFVVFMKEGVFPKWNFAGEIVGKDGKKERIVYNNCIPNGDIDIQNVTTGELIKRSWSFQCNDAPIMENILTRS